MMATDSEKEKSCVISSLERQLETLRAEKATFTRMEDHMNFLAGYPVILRCVIFEDKIQKTELQLRLRIELKRHVEDAKEALECMNLELLKDLTKKIDKLRQQIHFLESEPPMIVESFPKLQESHGDVIQRHELVLKDDHYKRKRIETIESPVSSSGTSSFDCILLSCRTTGYHLIKWTHRFHWQLEASGSIKLHCFFHSPS
jgi:hypothetical protein